MSFDLWTLGFQAANVLVLVWLLHRFFWKPVSAMVARRQEKAAALLDDADAKRAAAERAMAEVEATREGLTAERDGILAAARKDAEATRASLLDAARAEADSLQDTAQKARVRAAATLKTKALEEAQELALTIARKLLARLESTAADAAFLGWLLEGIAALPDPDRKALAAAKLEVVSATTQDGAARDRIATAIAKALGAPVSLTFRADPALIAGLELHGAHFTLRNSWSADLARIAATLGTVDVLSDAE